MQRLFLLIFSIIVISAPAQNVLEDSPHAKGEIIIMLRTGSSIHEFVAEFQSKGLVSNRCLAINSGIWLIKFDTIFANEKLILEEVRSKPSVQLAQFNHHISSRGIPDDTQFPSQYALNNTGQGGGTLDADIDAVEAWDISTGGRSALGDTIVVAVIDAGVQLTHPDLNFWKNYHEIPANGLDDDGNGFIDDVNGWNVFTHSGNIVNNQHGTHVAGIIGARGNNSSGISGVNWNVKLMPVVGATTIESEAVEAYSYVLECRRLYNNTNGAKGAFVVSSNSSFGVNQGQAINFPIWCAMYDSLGKVGVLSAAATANNNWNIDVVGDIPCACASQFLIGVSSTDRNDAKVINSGYGVQSIDLAAPGASIYSTYPTSTYATLTGTSMASPHVAGTLALMYAAACDTFMRNYNVYPDSMALVVRNILMNSVDQKVGFDTLYYSGGRLNAFNALVDIQNYSGCLATGLNEEIEAAGKAMFRLFPNPSIRFVSVSSVDKLEGSSYVIQDISGRKLKTGNLSQGATELDLSDLDEGVYFVQIENSLFKPQKLIKIK